MRHRAAKDDVTAPITGNDASLEESTVGSMEPAYAVEADTAPGGPPDVEEDPRARDILPDRVVRRDDRGATELPEDDEPLDFAPPEDLQPEA